LLRDAGVVGTGVGVGAGSGVGVGAGAGLEGELPPQEPRKEARPATAIPKPQCAVKFILTPLFPDLCGRTVPTPAGHAPSPSQFGGLALPATVLGARFLCL
jgi:hypothetical protein